MDFYIYPCNKSGKILKGFCPTICDAAGLYSTIKGYVRFASKFGIKFYSLNGNIIKL